jgi:hypothetical protein
MQFGECKRLPVVGRAAFGIDPIGMGRDVAQQVQRMGRKARLMLRRFNGARSQTPRVVQPAEHQTGAPRRVVSPAGMANDALRRLVFNEQLTLSDPAERLAGMADLRQRPGGRGDCPGKEDGYI